MRYSKKFKYKLRKEQIFIPDDKDLTAEELYQKQLRSKMRLKKR